jgi:hypothetical protein
MRALLNARVVLARVEPGQLPYEEQAILRKHSTVLSTLVSVQPVVHEPELTLVVAAKRCVRGGLGLNEVGRPDNQKVLENDLEVVVPYEVGDDLGLGVDRKPVAHRALEVFPKFQRGPGIRVAESPAVLGDVRWGH